MSKIQEMGVGILVVIYIILKPIYLFDSGSVQLSDAFIILITLYLILKNKCSFQLSKFLFRPLLLFAFLCLYQLIINCLWTFVLDDVILKPVLYYLFNFIAFFDFLVIGSIIGLQKMKKAVMYGCLVSLIISLLSVTITAGFGRSIGLFNNPNQLGYYALIIFSLILLCGDELTSVLKFIMLTLSVVLVVASLSKAAILGMAGMSFLFIIFSSIRKKLSIKHLLFRLTTFLLACTFVYLTIFSNNELILSNVRIVSLRYRIINMQNEKDSSFGEGRGYDRVLELGSHFFWGMGEGAYYRFNIKTGSEVHSTYASLLSSYGLFGFLGYLTLFILCALNNKGYTINNIIILSGVFLYQFTHNGIRNTLLWLLLALVLLQKVNYHDSKDNSYILNSTA